jgi:hypothetical protein
MAKMTFIELSELLDPRRERRVREFLSKIDTMRDELIEISKSESQGISVEDLIDVTIKMTMELTIQEIKKE